MKKTLLLGALMGALSLTLAAQTAPVSYANAIRGAENAQDACNSRNACLVPTQNIFSFLELETQTGAVWFVQFGDSDHRFRELIGVAALDEKLSAGAPLRAGRFALYPTQNIYTFLLLDRETLAVWQVQWGDQPQMIRIQAQTQPAK